MDREAVEEWVRSHVEPVGPIEVTHERPWSTVCRVPLEDRVVWFKACSPVQAFEARMTAALAIRWPDVVPDVIAHDDARAWLLLGDAGTPIGDLGNPPHSWAAVLPAYAELQRGETSHVTAHLEAGVPDLRVETLPVRFEALLADALPLTHDEIRTLRAFAPRFADLCAELASSGIADTVQHDDLHGANVYTDGERLRVLDWGDSSISHPFASLVVTYRFLDEVNHLPPDDPWFTRLRDAYLEPWGPGLEAVFELGVRVGAFAHVIAWQRQRDALAGDERTAFDEAFSIVLRRAVARTFA